MSRSIIAGVVAVVIAALTATAYFATTSSQEERVQKDLRDRVRRARDQILQTSTLEGLAILKKVEALAAAPEALDAIKAADAKDSQALARLSDRVFTEYRANEKTDPPDVLALVNDQGDVVAMHGIANPTAGEFKADGKVIVPALAEALQRRIVISEIWRLPDVGLVRIGIAPVIDHEASAVASAEAGEEKVVIKGAVVAAYALTARAAQAQDDLLGVRVAYFDGEHVSATSFRRGGGHDENTEIRDALSKALAQSGLRQAALSEATALKIAAFDVGGEKYVASSVRMPRFATKDLPKTYPDQTVGALVLVSVGAEASEFVKPAKTFILLVGLGSLVVALFGMYLVYRRIETQIDQVELGIAEIINGNLDRTFQPVGDDLDGVANGLNVMLARLLGRPEPGEEAFDENGNPIVPGRVDFEEAPEGEAPAAPAADPELAALAQEPEPDYYKRLFTEYVAARKAAGSSEEVSFESFIAKLRVNEGKLKAQYQCRAVRFRVVTKDGKVTLKPVPI
ncbi:MAG: hypothetical protein KC464_23915, partial [Myxococcales bacterium]|nr:hypothetical protein [Myxococcales bacterium]